MGDLTDTTENVGATAGSGTAGPGPAVHSDPTGASDPGGAPDPAGGPDPVGAGDPAGPDPATPADTAAAFEAHRPHLLGVAYRMLGSIADAEVVVQEAWLRLARVDPASIHDLRGWLTTVTGRLCLDRLRAVRAAREAYVGPWLPEPLVARQPSTDPDPADVAVLAESVRMALLLVLERLTPEQRVAFVLHDVFSVPFDEVAGALGVSTEAARQLASRGRRAVAAEAPRRPPPREQQRAILERFLDAAAGGDLDALLALLAPDVELQSDGGGLVTAARRPIRGADKVGRFLLGLTTRGAGTEFAVEPTTVNGQWGAVVRIIREDGGREPFAVFVADVTAAGAIDRISFVLNPEKLTRVPR